MPPSTDGGTELPVGLQVTACKCLVPTLPIVTSSVCCSPSQSSAVVACGPHCRPLTSRLLLQYAADILSGCGADVVLIFHGSGQCHGPHPDGQVQLHIFGTCFSSRSARPGRLPLISSPARVVPPSLNCLPISVVTGCYGWRSTS